MHDLVHPEPRESMIVGQMLSIMARRVSYKLIAFSGWLTTGFGAAFGLVLANVSSVATYVSVRRLKVALILYLVGVVLHVGQRVLAAMISAAASAGRETQKLVLAPATPSEGVRVSVILRLIEDSTPWSTRWLVRRSFAKIMSGDLAIGGRMLYKLAQYQAYATAVQALLCVAGATIVALGLKV